MPRSSWHGRRSRNVDQEQSRSLEHATSVSRTVPQLQQATHHPPEATPELAVPGAGHPATPVRCAHQPTSEGRDSVRWRPPADVLHHLPLRRLTSFEGLARSHEVLFQGQRGNMKRALLMVLLVSQRAEGAARQRDKRTGRVLRIRQPLVYRARGSRRGRPMETHRVPAFELVWQQ